MNLSEAAVDNSARRRRIIKFMLLYCLFSLLLLIAIWFWVTQPLFSSATPNAERTVDPSRLEAHVRKLSIELARAMKAISRISIGSRPTLKTSSAKLPPLFQSNLIVFRASLIAM